MKKWALTLLLCLTAPQTLFAATQGNFGATSEGGSDVFIVLGLQGLITGLNDLSLGPWSGTGPLTANDNLCVGLMGTTQYQIRAEGDGNTTDPAAFTLVNGTDVLYYRAFFNDRNQVKVATSTRLTGGQLLPQQNDLNATRVVNNMGGCIATNANIYLEITQAELQQAVLGTYSGTLTLTLVPE